MRRREKEAERRGGEGGRGAMTVVGGQLTSVRDMASSAVLATANSSGGAGNGGPLAASKAGVHSFTKLPILPNMAFGEIFVPSTYNFGAASSHAKVRERETQDCNEILCDEIELAEDS